MDGSPSHARSHIPAQTISRPGTVYQSSQIPAGGPIQTQYQTIIEDSVASSTLGPLSLVSEDSVASSQQPQRPQQQYNAQGTFYVPPFVPGLGSSADPLQYQQYQTYQSPSGISQSTYVPRWQPDCLVQNCPICLGAFTLFYRRHHCRKCGRVVCAPCSSFRLTLPSSAVVRPPTELPTTPQGDTLAGLLNVGSSSNNSSGSSSNRHSWAGSLSSGDPNGIGFFDWRPNSDGMEDVRVCSDCNATALPATQSNSQPNYISNISSSNSFRNWNGAQSSNGPSLGPPDIWSASGVNTPNVSDIHGRRRRQSIQGGRSLPYNYGPSTPPSRGYGPNTSGSSSQHPQSNAQSAVPYSNPSASSNSQNSLLPSSVSKYTAYFGAPERLFNFGSSSSATPPQPQVQVTHSNHSTHSHSQTMISGHPSRHTHSHPSRSRNTLPPAPVVKLKETDYCPICTLPLPPVPDNGDESARETHIQDCIRSHEAASSPRRSSVSPSGAASHLNNPNGTPESGPVNIIEFLRQSGTAKVGGRMVVYKAKEADTWDYSIGGDDEDNTATEGNDTVSGYMDGDGEGAASPPNESSQTKAKKMEKQKIRKKAECVICFEEFEVGEAIARLECLCRYHKTCIREWFDRKGNGDCPVHAVRE